MIFVDQMKNFKIYKTKTFLPTLKDDKKKYSAILLMTPNFESSNKLMNSNLFVNKLRYMSYYLEKDISFYINSKVVEEIEESKIISERQELESCLETKRSELDDDDFGVPSKRKFPLDTEAHVRSAIRFFNYVDPEDEEELARRIIKAIKKFNITGIYHSDKNRFFKYYKAPRREDAVKESYNLDDEDTVLTEEFLSGLRNTEDTLNLGDKILFFNEATNANDARLKKLLFKQRIRYRKEVLLLLDKVKDLNPWIKFAFPEIAKYKSKNIFMDLYYYNAIFFQNNTWQAKRGFNLYLDFVDRLINHPVLKQGGYKKKTIFIPVLDWDTTKDGMLWNYRKNINPISCIYQLMFDGSNTINKIFGNTDVVFVGSDNYFKINFSQLDQKEFKKLSIKFKLFVNKMCKNEEFDGEDVEEVSDSKESKEVIAAKLVDKVELTKGVDLTKKVATAMKNKEDESIISTVAKKNGMGITPTKDELAKLDKVVNKKADIAGKCLTNSDSISLDATKKKVTDDLELDDYSEEEDIETEEDLDKLADDIATASDNYDNEEDAADYVDANSEDGENLSDEELKDILLSGDGDDVDISEARSERIKQLNEQVLDKKIGDRTVKEIIEDQSNKEPIKTTVNVASPNKDEWKDLTFMNFDKKYSIEKDILRIFRHFGTCKRPIAIRDITVTDNSTSQDRVALYDVDMEDYRGKRFNIKLDIPIMEDNRFLLRGNNKSIQTQFFNMPIIKTDLDACQLISNYQKIFLYRQRDYGGKSLPAVSKFMKAAKKYTGRKIKFTYSDNTAVCSKYKLPIDYIDLAGTFNTIETEDYIIYFNQATIREKYTIDKTKKGFPFAYNKKLNAIEYFDTNHYDTFIKFICDTLFNLDSSFKEVFDAQTRTTSCAFSQASIMSSKIPLILLLAYYIGLTEAMNRAKIQFVIVDKLTNEIRSNPNLDWIQFEDGFVVYTVTYGSSLLMSGLKNCSTELFPLSSMDTKDMYIEFLDNYGGRIKADGFDNFYDLFVDPLVKDSLEHYKLPTNFIDIIIYGNNLLADNKFVRHTDTSSRKLRRYELIAVYTYKILSDAYGSYANELKHSKQSATFSVKQSAVIDAFLADSITSDDSCINALRDVETTNAITTKGPSGLNASRGYSLDKRTYDESMLNILGMSTGFAGNVGITRQATINADVDPEGYINTNSKKTEMNDSNSLTATEALIPFGSTRDDPMRTAMSFIQTSKHMVKTEESDPLLVTSGIDEVMPYLTTDKFAYKAKDKGTILEINDEYILVEYENGKKDFISLKESIEKNSDGGYFVPLKVTADAKLKVGSKINKDQILAYDKYSFSNSVGESDNIAYNIGKLAKVAILNTDEGFEDSGIMSEAMANKLATKIDLQYDTVVEKDSTIFKIAKIGDHIEAQDDLLVWQDAFDDEDTAAVISGLETNGEYSDIGKRKLKSEVTGTLKEIKIFRTVEIEELSPSLQKIVTEYEAPYKKQLEICKANGISISKVPACYKLNPTGKLKKAQEAIMIEFYVEYLDSIGAGDKIVYNAANKAVEKGLFPLGKEPYTEFRPNEKIDAFLSDVSVSKRLVTSIPTYGALQKLVIELDRSVKDILGIPYDDSTV